MESKTASKGLGKGLSALMSEEYSATVKEAPRPSAAQNTGAASTESKGDSGSKENRILSIPVESLHSGMYQPRQHFDNASLEELAESIRVNGIMQPIIVRASQEKTGLYEIIAGERRWRAAQKAELNYVPVIVRDIDDKQTLELALIENIQRQDLSPLEEARGFKRLMEEFHYTQEGLSTVVGKSRSHVSNLIRLLTLPASIHPYIDDGSLSMGHARALIGLENEKMAEEIAAAIIEKGLNVRQVETLRRKIVNGEGGADTYKKTAPKRSQGYGQDVPKPEEIQELEGALSNALGMNVTIQDRGNRGAFIMEYESLAQLDDIIQRLTDSAI